MRSFLVGLVMILFSFGIFSSPAWAVVQTPKKGVGGQLGTTEATEKTPPVFKALGISWFYNWSMTYRGFLIAPLACVEFVPMVRYKKSDNFREGEIKSIINKGHKGIYWLIGNEPDFTGGSDGDGYLASQDELLTAYTNYAKIIKANDPTAKLILGGFLSITDYPGKTPVAQNFARVLKDKLLANGIRPDGWHVHSYTCCSLDNFKITLANWKDWQNKNLLGGETWVTEFGNLQLQPWPPISNYMRETVNFMETHNEPAYKVDRYAWFPLTPYSQTAPLTDGQNLTPFGNLYASLPDQGPQPTPKPCVPSPTPTLTLAPTPTPTPSPGPKILNLLVKMKGVKAEPGLVWQRAASFKVRLGQQETSASGTVNEQGVWTIKVTGLTLTADTYDLFIKGPKHLQKKFANITFTNAASQIIDLTALGTSYYLAPGDLPIGNGGLQDGVVNSLDAVYLTDCFATPEEAICLARADLNLDGTINTLDMELMNETVLSKWEDEVE